MRSVPLDRSCIKIHLTQMRREIGKNEDRERGQIYKGNINPAKRQKKDMCGNKK